MDKNRDKTNKAEEKTTDDTNTNISTKLDDIESSSIDTDNKTESENTSEEKNW